MCWLKYIGFQMLNLEKGNAYEQGSKPAFDGRKKEVYQSIFEAVNDGLIIIDLESGLVVDANPAAWLMHGYAREEFIGLKLTALIIVSFFF